MLKHFSNIVLLRSDIMNCQTCNGPTKRFGKDRNGVQRFRCLSCKKTSLEPRDKPLGEMRLPLEEALSVIQHLVEGCSIRSTERITGVEKRTILSLLELVGERCEKLMLERIKGLSVKDVQADEIWGWVGMKQKTKHYKGLETDLLGDAYCF